MKKQECAEAIDKLAEEAAADIWLLFKIGATSDENENWVLARCRKLVRDVLRECSRVAQPEEPDWMTGHPGGISEA